MKRLSNKDDLISDSWLDDCVKHIYFFESVVLQRAKKDKNFTEQEIIDMIGKIHKYQKFYFSVLSSFKWKGIFKLSLFLIQKQLYTSIFLS